MTSVRVVNRIPRFEREALEKVERSVRAAALLVEAEAKARAPVDTGFLRNAINQSGEGTSYRVDSPAEYSIYQELGTLRMGPRPFLRPALESVAPKLRAMLGRLA